MNSFLISLVLLFTQADFTSFSFCREELGAIENVQCLELDPSGEGIFKLTSPDADTIDVAIQLSADATVRFVGLLAGTDYLLDGDQYESGRPVANLGIKTLVAEGSWGRREAVFNFSTRREVRDLASFLDRLIIQEMLLLDIEAALLFDRLGIPRHLDNVQKQLRADRFADARRWIPVLERIEADSRILNFARSMAAQLKEEIEENY